MKWLRNIFGAGAGAGGVIPGMEEIQRKFQSFLTVLDCNNRVLKMMGDLEEKAQGDYLFDVNYITKSVSELRAGVGELIEAMIELGGAEYEALRRRYAAIDAEISDVMPGGRPITADDWTIPFDNLGRDRAYSVGSKNAQLGEMKSVLGLPVPDGYAISAWAYKRFVAANNLQERISSLIESVDVKRHEDLVQISDRIRTMVIDSPVPTDLAAEIRTSMDELRARCGAERFAVRSSAIGEDTRFSFAGQYHSCLNVRGDEIVERYREVIASKFSPKAIYYFLSHALSESDLAMSVGCVQMVDAAASGVIYTRDPVRPDDDCVVVHAIYGLGEYLVRGKLTPDVFRVSRDASAVRESLVAPKPVRLVAGPDGGTVEQRVPDETQRAPAVDEAQLKELVRMAVQTEEHYGGPQDIEWAIDHAGNIFVLQTRPLRVVRQRAEVPEPDASGWPVLQSGGVTASPGAGCGAVYHAGAERDLQGVPEQAVLVATHPFPGLVTAMDRISALVAEVGGVASHMATIAREYRIPTLVGLEGARNLEAGQTVTVDATQGVIYAGEHAELVEARRPETELFEDTEVFNLLEQVSAKTVPLNLISPTDPGFRPENCRTFHDITRYAHQKAMEEMLTGGVNVEKRRCSVRLKSKMPIPVNILFIDQDMAALLRKKSVHEDDLASEPMKHFWAGVREEGWPAPAQRFDAKGFMTVIGTSMTAGPAAQFLQESFAILSQEYMIVGLHMGYHFTTIEAMCTDEVSKNYVRMQYKQGGASMDRRVRRVRLITEILGRAGFEHTSEADFLDTRITYQSREAIAAKLHLLGRLTMMTKQLDMALSNDAIAAWYTRDFMRKLGLEPQAEGTS